MASTEILYDRPEYDGTLRYQEFPEAVECIIDSALHFGKAGLPDSVDVARYRRDHLDTQALEEHFIEHLTEMLHESYGNHDSYADPDEPSDRLKAAARIFVHTMHREYQPWSMSEAETVSVNVRQWVRETWAKENIWHYIAHAEATGDTDYSGFPERLPEGLR